MSLFMEVRVKSIDDLVERYKLLDGNSRMRLCTLAHFWNYSSPTDRMEYFKTFLSLIGGEVPSEESERFSNCYHIATTMVSKCSNFNSIIFPRVFDLENMKEMPMHNYSDLPRQTIEPWVEFLESLGEHEKCELMEKLWKSLESYEQDRVVIDLKEFLRTGKATTSIDDGSDGSSEDV